MTENLINRISFYLASGGLFNPELADHLAVRNLLMECREALAQPKQEPVAWMDDYNACKCPDNEARCFSDKVFRMMQKHTDSLVKQQEPVAKVCHDFDGHIGWNPNLLQLPDEGTPLYTTPPQRTWIGLTDEECIDLMYESGGNEIVAIQITEAKLKEKNT